VEKKSDTWVNLNEDLHFLDDQLHFIWASEKDGYKHLYLHKNNGELKRQLTKGNWVVDKIEAIDQKNALVCWARRYSYSMSFIQGWVSLWASH
jgi:dipeptidyl-peptidase-4